MTLKKRERSRRTLPADEEHPEPDGESQAGEGAEQRDEAARGEGDGGQKEGGLDPFPEDHEEGEEEEAGEDGGRVATVDDLRQGPLHLAGDVLGVAPHPDDHGGDHGGGSQVEEALEDFLVDRHGVEGPGAGEARQDGGDEAGPDGLEVAAEAVLLQEGVDDAHHQGGLDAFAQGDDQGLDHGNLSEGSGMDASGGGAQGSGLGGRFVVFGLFGLLGLLRQGLGTGLAEAEDLELAVLAGEAVGAADLAQHGLDGGADELHDAAAAPAGQVVVALADVDVLVQIAVAAQALALDEADSTRRSRSGRRVARDALWPAPRGCRRAAPRRRCGRAAGRSRRAGPGAPG